MDRYRIPFLGHLDPQGTSLLAAFRYSQVRSWRRRTADLGTFLGGAPQLFGRARVCGLHGFLHTCKFLACEVPTYDHGSCVAERPLCCGILPVSGFRPCCMARVHPKPKHLLRRFQGLSRRSKRAIISPTQRISHYCVP